MAPSKQTQASIERTTNQSESLPDFQASLNSIVNRPLDPETIDTYADGALSDLIDLTEKIVTSYKRQPTHSFNSEGETEDAAFKYFGLGDIDGTLEHLIAKSEQIRHYDELIEQLRSDGDIIVPTHGHANIAPGNGEFEYKRLVPRLKTLLLILAEDFDLDVDDSEQVRLRKGIVTSEMMRKESYVMVEVPKLGRTILVCDEEGNATYVLDSAVLGELSISSDELANLTKPDLNYYLNEQAGLGKRLVYGKNFVGNIIKSIDDLSDTSEADESPEAGRYLTPKAPEGILSANGLADKLGISAQPIRRAAEELGDSLGVRQYKFGSHKVVANGYDSNQQEAIRQHLESGGLFMESAPEGTLSVLGLVDKLGINHAAIQRVVEELGGSLGEVRQYKFGSHKVTNGYDSAQQEMIRQRLEAEGAIAQAAPEGVLSALGFEKKIGINVKPIRRAAEELGDRLGEVKRYLFGSNHSLGYNLSQQEIIRQHLEERGLFAELAPEGILSAKGLANKIGVSPETVRRAINMLGDSLGEVRQYRFGSTIVGGYNFNQQTQIEKFVMTDSPGSALAKLAKASIEAA